MTVAAADIEFYIDTDPATGKETVIVSDTVTQHQRAHAEFLARQISEWGKGLLSDEQAVECHIWLFQADSQEALGSVTVESCCDYVQTHARPLDSLSFVFQCERKLWQWGAVDSYMPEMARLFIIPQCIVRRMVLQHCDLKQQEGLAVPVSCTPVTGLATVGIFALGLALSLLCTTASGMGTRLVAGLGLIVCALLLSPFPRPVLCRQTGGCDPRGVSSASCSGATASSGSGTLISCPVLFAVQKSRVTRALMWQTVSMARAVWLLITPC